MNRQTRNDGDDHRRLTIAPPSLLARIAFPSYGRARQLTIHAFALSRETLYLAALISIEDR